MNNVQICWAETYNSMIPFIIGNVQNETIYKTTYIFSKTIEKVKVTIISFLRKWEHLHSINIFIYITYIIFIHITHTHIICYTYNIVVHVTYKKYLYVINRAGKEVGL